MADSPDNKLSFWQMVRSTLMSFLGVQKDVVRQRDFAQGNPVHFILIGLLLTVVFVVTLIVVVRLILPAA